MYRKRAADFVPLFDNKSISMQNRIRKKKLRQVSTPCFEYAGKYQQNNYSLRPPWAKANYSLDVLGLHEEINDFCEFMRPTTEEAELRLAVVKDITKVVHSLWPYAKVEVFGSYRTGLYLPLSDIDLVIFGKWKHLPLYALSKALEQSGIRNEDIFVISSSTVPIIRLRHTLSRIKVDISFNQKNGVEGAKLIKKYIKTYPVLPKLIFVLKQFLVNRNLNEVYSGGMRSYCLMVLVVSFLQGYHKPEQKQSTNLGTLLIEFFELFGVNFNYKKISIEFRNREVFFKPGCFSIKDPLSESNDISAGTQLRTHIQPAFEYAYHVLHDSVTKKELQRPNSTILQQIIHVDNDFEKDRSWIKSNFSFIMEGLASRSQRGAENLSKD